jgi:hypothetical protein
MFRGNDQERETARQRLDELLTKNRTTWGDVSRLIAPSHSNPETTRNDSEGEDEPPASPDDKMPNLFELAEWTLRRFLFLEEHQLAAAPLWVLHCFVFRDFQHTPRLALLSPTRGCGKSVMVNLLAKLRPRARKLGSETTATLPRLIDRDAPTLLLDETDNINFAKDGVLRSIVNDGFENGGIRMLMINGELREFRLFAPLAFGAIGQLPTPLMSRSVVINMCRAPKNAGLERLNLNNPTLLAELGFVYRQAFDWAQKIRGQLNADPAMPDGFFGRVADRRRVLFSIADALGHGNRARLAVKSFVGEHSDVDIGVILLSDVRRVFGAFAEDRIKTSLLLQHVLALDDAQCTEFCGVKGNRNPKALTESEMVGMIRGFGIRIHTIYPRGPRVPGSRVVCTKILNSGVVVMESAKDGARIDETGPLNRARARRILVQ